MGFKACGKCILVQYNEQETENLEKNPTDQKDSSWDEINYFDNIYPNNPLVKIKKWSDAKEIIDNWNHDTILLKRKECFNWWNQYLLDHKNFVKKKIYE